ncbi:MAG TPA: cysteine desulfurase-like protein [Pyrinomonadaceae bacterium]|nr:cysteine desulfurase-like protein [Pyrinomonadaceae bacterium]
MSSSSPAANTTVASVQEIRAQFPAVERIHNGYPVAYFDGPGGTQVPRHVVEAMSDYLYHHNANTHWAYPTSAETDAAIEHAREACAEFVNASPGEIAFGANMTTLTFHLARALGKDWGPGDEIVVTELDHHANIDPWERLAKELGVTVRRVCLIPDTGQLDWDDFEQLVGRQTRLIAIGAASNALGTINDVPRAIELARSVNAKSFVDAVHFVPHELADVRSWGCDFLGMSAYKFYGPHIGVLYCRSELMEAIDFPKLVPSPDTGPERSETGTQNQEGMVGAGAAVDFLASLAGSSEARRDRLRDSYAELHQRSAVLVRRLWNGLAGIKGVKLFGPPPELPRTATVSFVIDGVTSTDVARRLAERGLFLSHGDFYAATVIERLDLEPEGLVRAGCACYTTTEEVERLIIGVGEIAGRA